VAIGRYTCDLEKGDVLGPVEFTMSKFVVREYAHAVEMHQPCFQNGTPRFAPPTLVHLSKLRLYKHACPGGAGPSARLHVEYDATIHAGVPVDVPLHVRGVVVERETRRGREYVVMEIELRTVADDRLLVTYRDTIITAYVGTPGFPARAAA
jgi:hypothetical protein